MCRCDQPTINGQGIGEYAKYLAPPTLRDMETMVFDEPGRCGGIDSHAYHFMVAHVQYLGLALLVRHGGGEERIRLSNEKAVIAALTALDSNGRYWMLHAIYHAQDDAAHTAREHESARWQKAAAERRIKVRKVRGQNLVRVSIN